MIVDVLTGVPGCGKSTTMRREALNAPGLYLFAMPTIALIEEQAAAFRIEAEQQKIDLHVFPIHNKSKGRSKGSVGIRMELALKRINDERIPHAVMLITHETLMSGGLADFQDWHARIDEAPAAIQGGKVKIRASSTCDFFKENFALKPVTKGWSKVEPLTKTTGFRDREDDVVLKNMNEFSKYANRETGVFVNVSEWSRGNFNWCAIWTPLALDRFQSVQIAGASYLTSIGGLIARRWEARQLQFVNRPLLAPRTGQPSVQIHYFTESHEGTTELWDESPGRAMIVPICDYLAGRDPPIGFWSANDVVQKLMEHRVPGGPVKPKVAGLNQYMDKTSCAFIFSAKAMDKDEPIKELFDITNEEILRAREEEDILQFVMRGAIRKTDFGEKFDIYVYSLRQAQKLKAQLDASAIGTTVLVPVPEARIMDAIPVPVKPAAQTPKERGEKARLRAKANREKKALKAGRPVGQRGRPQGSKSESSEV